MQTRAAITAVNGYLPEFTLSNQVLETMVETSDAWITERTGIKERRIAERLPGQVDAHAAAGRDLYGPAAQRRQRYAQRQRRYDAPWQPATREARCWVASAACAC